MIATLSYVLHLHYFMYILTNCKYYYNQCIHQLGKNDHICTWQNVLHLLWKFVGLQHLAGRAIPNLWVMWAYKIIIIVHILHHILFTQRYQYWFIIMLPILCGRFFHVHVQLSYYVLVYLLLYLQCIMLIYTKCYVLIFYTLCTLHLRGNIGKNHNSYLSCTP